MHDPRVALLAVAFILVLGPWLLWRIPALRRVAPLAVIQILAGVALGPSLLGRIAPELQAALFGPATLPALNGLATIGVLLFVFCSGLHLDLGRLRSDARALSAAAVTTFAVPLLLGAAAGCVLLFLVPDATGPRGGAGAFVAAVAICVAVTALPVLAAILREMELITTRFGQTALALSAVNDAALWLMLAVLLAIAAEGHGVGTTLLLALLWAAALGLVVRPLLARLAAGESNDFRMLALGAATALASSGTAEAIGIGYIIGGFAAGVIMPPACRTALLLRIEPVTATVLLPFFFMSTGLRALINPASSAFLAVLLLTTAATMLGKVAGAALPARAAGESWPFALALGVMMQTKGLMEVVVLAVLLEAGLIGRTVFSGLVAMAVVTTILAAPLTRALLARRASAAAVVT